MNSIPTPRSKVLAEALASLKLEALPVEAVLKRALRNGGALAELFFEDTASTRIFFEGGRVDKVIDGTDRGCGLRIVFDKRQVYGYTTDLTETGLMNLAESLSAAVKTSEPAPTREIEWGPMKKASAEIAGWKVTRSPRDLDLPGKVELARRGDAAARKVLPDARQVTSVVLDSLRRILVINSDGIVGRDNKTYLQMFVQVVGEKDGRVETAH